MNLQLLIIDPQQDFCNPDGALYVPGAEDDMDRLANTIHNLKDKINNIHVSLDTHHPVDIAHSAWFIDENGNNPKPFTQITSDDLKNNQWKVANPKTHNRTLNYLLKLEEDKRYPHVIWPNHCLVGSWGHNIIPTINQALTEWTDGFNWVHYIFKGTNPYTEHFSALMAEVPDYDDHDTLINLKLCYRLAQADMVIVAGEASSHCVANTCLDLANERPELASKMVLLKDTASSVPSFEYLEDEFIKTMTEKGMRVSTSTEILKKL